MYERTASAPTNTTTGARMLERKLERDNKRRLSLTHHKPRTHTRTVVGVTSGYPRSSIVLSLSRSMACCWRRWQRVCGKVCGVGWCYCLLCFLPTHTHSHSCTWKRALREESENERERERNCCCGAKLARTITSRRWGGQCCKLEESVSFCLIPEQECLRRYVSGSLKHT